MSAFVIAVDGPSASGKSTVARGVARQLNCRYVDSGALYRAITWRALQQGIAVADTPRLAQWVKNVTFRFSHDDGIVRVSLDGMAPDTNDLRGDAVVEAVSDVAAVPDVRHAVGIVLREMTRLGPLVVEGRDIGTAVFPETPLKFFVDADPEERARRRSAETGADLSRVKQSLQRRDRKDRNRRTAPLRCAPDAVRMDTTHLPVEQVVDWIVRHVAAVRNKMNA